MSTVTKALSLLDLFTEARPAMGLSELQRASGRDKATVHRHLSALEDLGFLEQDPKSRAYRLGHALERLAAMRRLTVRAADTIAPIIDGISDAVGELVHVARLKGDDLHNVYHADLGHKAIRVDLEPNIVLPLLTTSTGKAILSCQDLASQHAVIAGQHARFGCPPMPAREPILEELHATRRRGYSTSRDTVEVGVSSVAIPLFDQSGAAVAACAVAYPTARYSAALLSDCLAHLFARGPDLVARLGGTVPDWIEEIWAAPPRTPELAEGRPA